MSETLDLVVIGAGWFGLCAAKTFHQLHPDASFAVLDQASTVGGVWAEHRLYPGLKSNNMLGTYEYPDFPMDTATYGVQPGQHIPGVVVHRYLTDYTVHFRVADHFRGSTSVVSATLRDDGGWTLKLASQDGKDSELVAKKLIVATGLTSEPFLPHFAGQETFGRPIFHGRDFLKHADTLDSAKTVAVFGGTKSAWDMVYAYASKGIQVEWIIRESGHGPIWQAPPYVTPLKKWLEKLVMTRMLTWFSPCIWGDADGYTGIRRFYHGTALGRRLTDAFWSVLGGDVLTLNRYDAHPETAKLKPWSEAMFTASSFSILNYASDFFELVRRGTVRVHIAEITQLSAGRVHLVDGTVLACDALACATGWKHVPPLRFLPEGLDKELGLPHAPPVDSTKEHEEPVFKPSEVARADAEILARFPRLRDQPIQNKNLRPLLESPGLSSTDAVTPSTPLTPYVLYRSILPPTPRFVHRRDIAFAGVIMNFSIPIMAQTQALWIAALFDDKLPPSVVPSATGDQKQETLDKLRYDTVLYSRFGKWRYPAGHGAQFVDIVFDALPYIDLLLGDLGLPIYRKGGLLAEATNPYGPEDYKNLVAEYQAKVSA